MKDYSKVTYNYRKHQTKAHRRKNKKFDYKYLYYAALLLLVFGTFINTINKPQVQPNTQTKIEVKKVDKTKLSTTSFNLPSLPFPLAFQAFAAESKVTPIPLADTGNNWQDFIQEAKDIGKIYNYPVNLIIAQAALESGRGTSSFAVNRNNFFGIGAYDWQPNQAFTYANPAQSIIDYIYVVKNNFPEAWNNRDNADTMLQLLESNEQGNQYATDPNYINKVESEPEWSQE